MGGFTFTNLTRRIEIGANCYCLELAGERIVLDCGLHPRFDGAAALPDFSRLPDGATADAIIARRMRTRITWARCPCSCVGNPRRLSS